MSQDRSELIQESARDVHASALVDAQYALWQLRVHRDTQRAIDALERIEARALSFFDETPCPPAAVAYAVLASTMDYLVFKKR